MSEKPTILAVDDDPAVTQYLEAKLSASYRMVTTNIPAKALDIAHTARPDLILVDVDMEGLDGFEEALGCSYASPDLYRAVWEAYMKLERFDRAHDLIMEGVERFPGSDRVQALAGDSFVYAKGDSAEARPYWEAYLRELPRGVDEKDRARVTAWLDR